MDLNQMKIELLQRIISCEDENMLREIKQILDENSSEVREEGDKYSVEVGNVIPDGYYQSLEADYEKYKRGELSTSSWDEVKKKLQDETEGLNISPGQEEELAERYERYLRDGGKTYSWEEIRKNIHEKHGL